MSTTYTNHGTLIHRSVLHHDRKEVEDVVRENVRRLVIPTINIVIIIEERRIVLSLQTLLCGQYSVSIAYSIPKARSADSSC